MPAHRVLVLVAASLALVLPARAGGASFVVNSTLDLPDLTPLGDGEVDADLETEGDQVTLRAALQEANAVGGQDSIQLPEGKFRLTRKGAGEDQCVTGDLDVTSDVTIFGAGAGLTIIDGKKAKDRVFDVLAGELQLLTLTVSGGVVSDNESGGGVRVIFGAALEMSVCTITKCKAGDDGGGLLVDEGSATLTACTVSRNRSGDDGGGIDVDDGVLDLSRCTIFANKASGEGGGLESSAGTLGLTNCTFAKNRAKVEGGAMSLEDGSATFILNCTIALNSCKVGSGIVEATDDSAADTVVVQNSILANKKTTNYAGDGLTSNGNNIDTGSTCGFGSAGDLGDTDPRLLKPKDNGGQTQTMALKDDSPAIDAGNDLAAPVVDQRNAARTDTVPDGAVSDIGAFEFGGIISA